MSNADVPIRNIGAFHSLSPMKTKRARLKATKVRCVRATERIGRVGDVAAVDAVALELVRQGNRNGILGGMNRSTGLTLHQRQYLRID